MIIDETESASMRLLVTVSVLTLPRGAVGWFVMCVCGIV